MESKNKPLQQFQTPTTMAVVQPYKPDPPIDNGSTHDSHGNRIRNFEVSQLLKHKNDIQKTWNIIKEVIGKKDMSISRLPKKLIINDCEIIKDTIIANSFNHAFVSTGPSLASKINKSKTCFKSYLNSNNNIMDNNMLTETELLDAMYLLKPNKGNGVDDVSSNVVIKSMPYLKIPLLHIFTLSLNQGIFPDKLKIARVIPILKSGDETSVSNYRPISILSYFLKLLEHIMYKRLYYFLDVNNILYSKQFGFKKSHSADQAIVHLVHDIFKSFDENKYTLGVFIDLISKQRAIKSY
ncbi:uncharacterized protein LOC136081403 [Hydra vulgaris]|uniref:Uncharacterized protein LOC136081403 n=1 Tax=Hydra vulgaris TaxID=6087 RepID=A0ABM4BZT5_HYDVU